MKTLLRLLTALVALVGVVYLLVIRHEKPSHLRSELDDMDEQAQELFDEQEQNSDKADTEAE